MLFKNKSPRLTPEAQLYHTRYHKAQSRRSQTLCRFHSRRDSSEREYLIVSSFLLAATNLSNGFENCKDYAGFFAADGSFPEIGGSIRVIGGHLCRLSSIVPQKQGVFSVSMPQNGVSRAKTGIVTEKPADSSVTIARKVCAWTPVAVLWEKCYRYPKISPHLLRFHGESAAGGISIRQPEVPVHSQPDAPHGKRCKNALEFRKLCVYLRPQF